METGVSFGRYRLVEKLGDGGMAMVFRAVMEGPEGFERPVCIKRVLPDLSSDRKFVDMFLSEAKLCARLHHPGIVQVQALGDVGGEYFLAMEFVDGLDLATILKRAWELKKPMSTGVACFVASELASALGYAHTLKDADGRALEIVHRDVSPSNVMLTRFGDVKLLDFGIARAAAHARVRADKTRTGTLKGKVSYMAPEQAEGLAVDGRTDLFALGIVLYECLTLDRLFRGEDEFETLRLVREARVFPPSSRCPDVDPDLDAIVLKLLAREPAARFQSGDEVVAALSPLVHRLGGDANGVRQFVAELSASTARAEAAATTPAKSPKSRPSLADPIDTVTRSNGELETRPADTARPRRRELAALGVGIAATAVVAGALVFALAPRRAPQPAVAAPPVIAPPVVAAPPPPIAQPPAKTVEPPLAKVVHLSVRGTDGAAVILDGVPAGRVPLELDLPAHAGGRALRVEHAGYQPLARTLAAAESATVDAALTRRRAKLEPAQKLPPAEAAEAPKPKPPVAQPEIKDPF
jgi:serine/threonine protein kinase